MTTKKFGLLRGLSDIFICEIKDSEEAYEPVGTPEKLIPAGELTISKTVDKAQTYFDNNLFEEVGREAPSELSIVGAAVRAAFLAWVEGKTVDKTTGAVIDDGDYHSKFMQLAASAITPTAQANIFGLTSVLSAAQRKQAKPLTTQPTARE